MRDLKIKPALNGYICQAGCQTLVFNDAKTMLYEIGRYLKDPSGVEKEYIKNAVNKMDGLPIPADGNAAYGEISATTAIDPRSVEEMNACRDGQTYSDPLSRATVNTARRACAGR